MSHPSNKVTQENVADVLAYHAPDAIALEKHLNIRAAATLFIHSILQSAPDCADRSAAIRHAREALFNANAAIALDPRENIAP